MPERHFEKAEIESEHRPKISKREQSDVKPIKSASGNRPVLYRVFGQFTEKMQRKKSNAIISVTEPHKSI
jgi:hypothetical protein